MVNVGISKCLWKFHFSIYKNLSTLKNTKLHYTIILGKYIPYQSWHSFLVHSVNLHMVQHLLQGTGKTQKNLSRPFPRSIYTIYIYYLNIKHLSCTSFHYSMSISVLNCRNFEFCDQLKVGHIGPAISNYEFLTSDSKRKPRKTLECQFHENRMHSFWNISREQEHLLLVFEGLIYKIYFR